MDLVDFIIAAKKQDMHLAVKHKKLYLKIMQKGLSMNQMATGTLTDIMGLIRSPGQNSYLTPQGNYSGQ